MSDITSPGLRLRQLIAIAVLSLSATGADADVNPITSAVARQDFASLVPVLESAADTGDAAANFRLSALYRLGLGVVQSYEASLTRARRAHEQGDPRGSFMLSILCARADCPENSAQLLALAAQQLPAASNRLAAPPLPPLPPEPESLVWMLKHPQQAATLKDTVSASALINTDALGRNALIEAIATGDVQRLEQLLDASPEPVPMPDSAVFAAVDSKNSAMLNTVLKHGGNPNAIDSRGTTALAFAVGRDRSGAAKSLLESDANPNTNVSAGTSKALAIAMARGDAAMAEQLRQAGATQLDSKKQVLLNPTPEELERFPGWSVIEIAAWQRQNERLAAILRLGEDTAERKMTASKALRLAAQSACESCIRLLLEHQASVNSSDGEGRQTLHWAARQPEGLPLIKALLAAGADPNALTHLGRSALMEAARYGANDSVTALLAAGADPGLSDRNGRTAMLEAVIAGDRAVTDALLAADADPTQADSSGRDALTVATLRQDSSLLSALIEGADPKYLNRYSWRPLLLMSIAGECRDCLQALLASGIATASLNNNDKENTPLMMASARGELEAVITLLAYKPDLGHRNDDGNSALMLAARDGHKDVVARLLEAGADALARNAMKLNARELAEAAGHEEVAQLINAYTSSNKSWLKVITG